MIRRPGWLLVMVLGLAAAPARGQSSGMTTGLLGAADRQAIVDELTGLVADFSDVSPEQREADLVEAALDLYAEKLRLPGDATVELSAAQQADARVLVRLALAHAEPPAPAPHPAPAPLPHRPPAPPRPVVVVVRPQPVVVVPVQQPVIYYYIVPTTYVPVVPVALPPRKHRLFHH